MRVGRIGENSAGVGEGLLTLLDGEPKIGQNSSRCGIKNNPTYISARLMCLSLIKHSTGIPGELYVYSNPNVTLVWDERNDPTNLFTAQSAI